jgi:hypothetical protein
LLANPSRLARILVYKSAQELETLIVSAIQGASANAVEIPRVPIPGLDEWKGLLSLAWPRISTHDALLLADSEEYDEMDTGSSSRGTLRRVMDKSPGEFMELSLGRRDATALSGFFSSLSS